MEENLRDARIAGFYQLAVLIGKGSFGQIYMGLDCRKNKLCAVKLEPNRSKYP